MRMYETIIIVQPELGEGELKALATKIQDVISTMNGDFRRLEDWGVRKLAYPINKVARGRYYYLRFDGEAPLIAELERRLRLDDKVVRYQSVKIEKDAGAATGVAKPAETDAVAEAEEGVAVEAEEAVVTEAPVEAAEVATESE